MKFTTAAALMLSLACFTFPAGAADMPVDASPPAATAGPVVHVHVPLGEVAPEILASTPDGDRVSLAALKGKPVVMQFASITEPLFRLRTPQVEKLAGRYGDKVVFLIIYTRESHPSDGPSPIDQNAQDGFDLPAPTSMAERIALAKEAVTRLNIKNEKMAVDAWSNTTALRYGNLPNMTFIIDADGVLQAGYPWMDPKKTQSVLDHILAHRTIPAALRGPIHPGRASDADYPPAAMEMTRGGSNVAVVIDHMNLSATEKSALMPALSQFLVDLRDYRQTRTGQPLKLKGAAAAAATAPATKEGKAEELEDDLTKLRASAKKLKDVCHDSLPPDKARQIIDAVSQGPARRLFAEK